MKTKLCLAAMVAALMILIGPAGSALALCASGTMDPSYCIPGKPVVSTTAASSVAATSATLNGTVNPNGQNTTYKFEYGSTTSYGTSTTVTTITAQGTSVDDYQAKTVSASVTGLTPNTLYHFRITAHNAGNATPTDNAEGSDLTFTTPAAATYGVAPTVVTGASSAVVQTGASVSGTINPNGGASSVAFEYGPTTAYGTRTQAVSAGSGTTPAPASTVLTGLNPGTLYHYRIVGASAAGVAFGLDKTFTTMAYVVTPPPIGRKRPDVMLSVTPRRDATAPFSYKARGALRRPAGVGKAGGCRGEVRITAKRGTKVVARRTAKIKRKNCKYSAKLTATKNLGSAGRGTLKVRAAFLGNSKLTPRQSPSVRVRFGPKGT